MKPEPLREKVEEIEIKSPAWSGGDIPVFQIFTKSSVKSAVIFYDRYKDGPEYKLKKEQPDAYNLYVIWRKRQWEIKRYTFISSVDRYDYNGWLYRYCFGDVIDD